MKKKKIVLFCFLVIMVAVFFIPFHPVSVLLEVEYDSSESNERIAELFWAEEDLSFHAEDSFSNKIVNNIAKIKLDSNSSGAVQYRFDFVNEMQEFGIAAISLYVDGIEKWSVDGQELSNYIQKTENISFYGIMGDAIWFSANNTDPIVVFNSEFADKLHSGITEGSIRDKILLEVLCMVVLIISLTHKRFSVLLSKTVIYKDFKEDNSRVFLWFAVLFTGVTTAVFWKYLTGEKLWIFWDIGSDSLFQTYPNLVYLAKEISQGNFKESWNGFSSLGDVRELICPNLYNWVAFFGEEHVAYLMGISQYLKVLFAGFIFYFYLRTMDTSRGISAVFAVCYAYCAQIIIRGSWASYPSEVVLFALWLLCFERFYLKKDYKWLPLATGIVFLNFSGYYVVLYTGIFGAYGAFRYYSEHQLKDVLNDGIREHVLFVASIVIGGLISAVNSMPSIVSSLSSSRFANGSGYKWLSPIFSGWSVLKTAYLRTIGTDITWVDYYTSVGYGNILEGPAFYCGLITIILIPFSMTVFKKKEKIWYATGFCVAVAYIICVPIRKIANGMAGITFKLASLWIMVLMLISASKGCELLKKQKFRTPSVATVVLVLVGLGVGSYIEGQNDFYFKVSLGIIIVYGGLIWLTHRKISFVTFNIILLLCCVGEVCWMSYRFANDRLVMEGEQLQKKTLYNDYTIDAIRAIEYLDAEESFYRIDKNYKSVFLCDSLYQGYHGTVGYVGGKGDRNLTGEFYESLGFPIYNSNHYVLGFSQSTAINTLMNVKFILGKEPAANYGYKEWIRVGNLVIYENSNALPLGITYDKFISREEFEQLTVAQKRALMMKAIVLETDDVTVTEENLEKISLSDRGDTLENISALQKYKREYSEKKEKDILRITFDALKEHETAVVKVGIDNKDTDLYVGSTTTNVGDRIIYGAGQNRYAYDSCFLEGYNEYLYEFNIEGTNWVEFKISDQMQIENLEVCVLPQSVYYKEYLQETSEFAGNSMETISYSENRILGKYTAGEPGIMFFSIPYDRNWHLYVDGQELPIMQANIGFMGAYIEGGDHEILLEYKGSGLYCILSVCGCIILVFYMTGCVIHEKKKKKFENEGKKESNDKDISGSSCL